MYRIVYDATMLGLQKKVKNLLDRDWKLAGGVAVDSLGQYIQAMYK